MACSVVRSPFLRNPTVRRYAVAATARSPVSVGPEVQVLGNKITIATLDSDSPIAQVSIIFRVGSRNETYDTQGVAHHLRIAAGLTTSRSSAFAVTRNIQQLGGNLSATVDRETIAYTLRITRNNLGEALTFLDDVATKPVFKPWELFDELPRLRYELSTISEPARVLELLHKAAYRTGLGYSLYSPKRQLGKISTETLRHFVNSWFTTSRCAVVATGVSLAELSAFATNLDINSGDRNNEASRYYGGELRKERSSDITSVAVAVEGAALNNEKDALACAILQRAAGTGPRVKWGSSASPLFKQVSSAAGTEPFALSTFNASYSDSGLFGFVLRSTPNVAGSLTKAACSWLKSMNVAEADIARGKNALKAEVLGTADNLAASLEDLQCQTLFKGSATTPAALANTIDKISPSDVKSVANKVAKGALTMASIGDLSTVPYIDQLN